MPPENCNTPQTRLQNLFFRPATPGGRPPRLPPPGRLGPDEDYKRALHKKLGTHMIVADFTDPALWDMMA